MAQIPPWLNVQPSDFVHAASQGAQAGLEAARTRQQGQEAGDRIGLESQRLAMQADEQSQQADESEARLSQAERIANMEMQARKDIAERNAMRTSQQMAIQQAYHQAQFGLGQQRIDQQKAFADQKMKEAALTFADEQGFANEVANGTPTMQAFAKYPRVKSSVLSAVGSHIAKDYGDIETVDLPGGAIAAMRPHSPGFKIVKTPVSEKTKIQLDTLKQRKHSLERQAFKEGIKPEDRAMLERRIKSIEEAEIALTEGTPSNSPFADGQKVKHADGSTYIIDNGIPIPTDEGEGNQSETDMGGEEQ